MDLPCPSSRPTSWSRLEPGGRERVVTPSPALLPRPTALSITVAAASHSGRYYCRYIRLQRSYRNVDSLERSEYLQSGHI